MTPASTPAPSPVPLYRACSLASCCCTSFLCVCLVRVAKAKTLWSVAPFVGSAVVAAAIEWQTGTPPLPPPSCTSSAARQGRGARPYHAYLANIFLLLVCLLLRFLITDICLDSTRTNEAPQAKWLQTETARAREGERVKVISLWPNDMDVQHADCYSRYEGRPGMGTRTEKETKAEAETATATRSGAIAALACPCLPLVSPLLSRLQREMFA